MVCVAFQELTVTCNVSGDTGKKIILLSRRTAIINTRQSSTHTHTPHTPQLLASTWLGDHQGRPSAPAIHRFTTIDIWRVTSRVIIIIITRTTALDEAMKQRGTMNGLDLSSELLVSDRCFLARQRMTGQFSRWWLKMANRGQYKRYYVTRDNEY